MSSKNLIKMSAVAMLISGATAVQQKEQWWGMPHLGFAQMRNPFFSQPSFGDFGMGFEDGFKAIEDDMHRMQSEMKKGFDGKHGDVHSESFSSSSSSKMGTDGKMHTKTQKQGQEKECHNGHCFVRQCANGVCKENEVDASADGSSALSVSKDDERFDTGFANMEHSIENSMRSMHDQFARVEHEMADTFGRAERAMESDMSHGRGNVHSESFSSSSSSEMGADGKMHKREQKAGSEVECHDGTCRQRICENGVCREQMVDQSTGELLSSNSAQPPRAKKTKSHDMKPEFAPKEDLPKKK